MKTLNAIRKFGKLMILAGLGLGGYWYNWKLALILLLIVIGYDLSEYKELKK